MTNTMEYDYENYFTRKEKMEHSLQKAKTDQRFLTHLKDVPTLNIGAGISAHLQTPQIKNIVCGDISVATVERLKKDGMNAICFDARQRWPFEDKSFEQIIAIDVFEHLGQVNGFLSELMRVARDDAIMVIGMPLLNNWRLYIKLLMGTTREVQYEEHPRLFFDKDVKIIFAEKGFVLQKVEYLGMKGYGYYTFVKKKESIAEKNQ